MADSKISDLAAVTDLQATDALVLARAGATKKITGADVKAAMAMALLYDSTLGADAASFDVSSISGAYKHLWLIADIRGTTAATTVGVRMRLNNDSSGIYDDWGLYTTGATSSQFQDGADTSFNLGDVTAASATSGRSSSFEAKLLNYAATTFHKNVLAEYSAVWGTASANHYRGSVAGVWRAASAVTRVTLFPLSGNWLAGSRLSIYGLN